MLPASLPENPGAESRKGRVALEILSLGEPHRQALTEWRDLLAALIARRNQCRVRTVNRALSLQLSSAIHSARQAITEACAPDKGRMVAEAAETISRYFRFAGDARAAAVKFPAVVEVSDFLRGPQSAETLNGLTVQAQETAAVIERILASGEIWHFETPKA